VDHRSFDYEFAKQCSGTEVSVSGTNLWCSRIAASALALSLTCQTSLAQRSSGDWTRVQTLPADSKISVRIKNGEKYQGDLVRATVDTLAIDSDEPAYPGRTMRRREVRRRDVQEIRLIRPAGSVVAGVAIGAGVGAGIGAGVDATAKFHQYRGVLALVLGVLGAGIGAAIANHRPLISKRIYVSR
jgi:hypothetical protein